MDYDEILQRSVGTIANPNTSFQEERRTATFQPIERWRRVLSDDQLKALESAVGALLVRLGYKLTLAEADAVSVRHRIMQRLYPRYFDIKQWMKVNTILGSLVRVERMHLSR